MRNLNYRNVCISLLVLAGGISLPAATLAAGLPQISDQMYCVSKAPSAIQNQASSALLSCMRQSTKRKETLNNLADVYTQGWIMISMQHIDNAAMAYIFYKQ